MSTDILINDVAFYIGDIVNDKVTLIAHRALTFKQAVEVTDKGCNIFKTNSYEIAKLNLRTINGTALYGVKICDCNIKEVRKWLV